jgi:hypothetical protein
MLDDPATQGTYWNVMRLKRVRITWASMPMITTAYSLKDHALKVRATVQM